MHTTEQHKQRGFTLIELMISLLVALIVIAGVISVFISTARSSSESLGSAKLNQELRGAMTIMASELRRAGHWGTAEVDNIDNPFQVPDDTDVVVLNGGNCILYAYDSPPTDGIVQNSERRGFRYVDSDADGTLDRLEMRTAGTANTACDDADDTWVPMTNPKVVLITAATFNLNNSLCLETAPDLVPATGICAGGASGDVQIEIRQVDISVDGELTSDSDVKKTLDETIRIRNEQISQVP